MKFDPKSAAFLNISNHGFRRVAVIVPRVHLGEPEKNFLEHKKWLDKAWKEGVFYAVFPELSISGYSLWDLFHQEVIQRESLNILGELVKESKHWPTMLFSVGLPLVSDNMMFNTAATILNGKILAIVPKSYPPEYREFYELRHFARAPEAISKELKLFGQTVPFGTDILLTCEDDPTVVIHQDICEDIWTPVSPGTLAALHGATILANLSASNITLGKAEYRRQLAIGSSARNVCVQMYSAAGFGETSSGLAWDGDGYIADRGELLARTERFLMEGTFVVSDVNLGAIVQDRIRQNSFRQNALDNRREFRRQSFSLWREADEEREKSLFTFLRKFEKHPFVPNDPIVLDERCYEQFNIQVSALTRKLLDMPEEMRRVFLGFSGGRDSLMALLVAVQAMDRLKLPRTNVVAFSLPGFGTSAGTKRIAEELPKELGVTFLEIPIHDLAFATFKSMDFDPETWTKSREARLVYENVQALCRKHFLFAKANQFGIVLGTGDLSELFLGWCTFGADQFSYYGINSGTSKLLISKVIGWAAVKVFEGKARELINAALALEISPELVPPGLDGTISQVTEQLIGPFELHEFAGYDMVRFGLRPSSIARLMFHVFEGEINPLTGKAYTLFEEKRWLRTFLERFFAAQKKRAAMPEGVKSGTVDVDPRLSWRVPSDVKPTTWINDLEANVPDEIKIAA